MENSNSGYEALKKLDLEMREKHHELIQVQDRVANLRKIKVQLIKENDEAELRIESLKLKRQAIFARRQTCQVRLETLSKEIENELQPENNKKLEKIHERERKRDYILQFQAEKLAEMDQIYANNLAHYKSMPRFAEYEKKKDRLQELEILTNEQRATLAMLKEKLAQRRALEEENWSKFKAICVQAAQNWKTRMEKEKREKRSITLGRTANKFSELSLFNSTKSLTTTRPLPSSTWRLQQTQTGKTSLLPNPFVKSKGTDNTNNSVKFGGFGNAWRNMAKSQTVRAVPYLTRELQQSRRRSTSLSNPVAKSYAEAVKEKINGNDDGVNFRGLENDWHHLTPGRRESSSNSQESTSSLTSKDDEPEFSPQSRRRDHSKSNEDRSAQRPLLASTKDNGQESTSPLTSKDDDEPELSPQSRRDHSKSNEDRSAYRPLLASNKDNYQQSASSLTSNDEPEFSSQPRDHSKSNEDRSAYRSSVAFTKDNYQESTSPLTSRDDDEPEFCPQSHRDRSKLDEGVFRRPLTPPTKDHPFSLPLAGFPGGEIDSGSKDSSSFFSGGEIESGSKGPSSLFPFLDQGADMEMSSSQDSASTWPFAPMSPASSEGSYEGGFEFFNFGSKDDDDIFDFSRLARNKENSF